MKKYTLNFGQFKQYDKKFITEIDGNSVTSVAFSGETLYIATTENTFEYSDGNLKKLSFSLHPLNPQPNSIYNRKHRSHRNKRYHRCRADGKHHIITHRSHLPKLRKHPL